MNSLPARPWIRHDVPLAWRSEDCIEIGTPPTHARLAGVDRGCVAWLHTLRGDRTLDEALDAGTELGLGRGALRRVLQAAVGLGLVDDAGAMPETLRECPPHLRDAIAGDLTALRQRFGGTPQAREAVDRRRRSEVAVHGDGALADAVAMSLMSAGIGNVVRATALHSSSRRDRRLAGPRTCHVLCDAAHPDIARDPDAMAMDIPHLAVGVAGLRAVVGPLVIPGRTSCLRCRELHLADADAAWPRLAVQWSRRRPVPVSAPLAQLAGAWAALQVLALVDEGSAPTLDAAIVVELPGGMSRLERRPAHPLCGCRWPVSGRSGAA